MFGAAAGIAIGVGLVLIGGWAVRNPDFVRWLSEKSWNSEEYTDWYVRWMPRIAQAFGLLVVFASIASLFA